MVPECRMTRPSAVACRLTFSVCARPAGPFDVAGEAAAIEQALLLRRLLARGKAVPVGEFRGALQHVRERAGVVDLADGVGVGQLRRLDVVHLADGARVHADLPRGGVHQPLDDEDAFRPARAAIGADRRGVGHHRLDLVMHQRQIVDAGLHERPEHQRNDGAGAGRDRRRCRRPSAPDRPARGPWRRARIRRSR